MVNTRLYWLVAAMGSELPGSRAHGTNTGRYSSSTSTTNVHLLMLRSASERPTDAARTVAQHPTHANHRIATDCFHRLGSSL